jgi:hypothetical protein
VSLSLSLSLSSSLRTPEVVPPPHVLSHPVVCVGVSLSLSLSISLFLSLSNRPFRESSIPSRVWA